MESRHCLTLDRAGAALIDPRARGVRRTLGRLRAIAFAVIVAVLIAAGERWLLIEAPAPGIEFGSAVRAAAILGGFGAADAVGPLCLAKGIGGVRTMNVVGEH